MNEEVQKIYEVEAILKQAEDIILQLRSAVNALKPKQSPKKRMTKEEVVTLFRHTCEKKKPRL
jgi:hypothetical protein